MREAWLAIRPGSRRLLPGRQAPSRHGDIHRLAGSVSAWRGQDRGKKKRTPAASLTPLNFPSERGIAKLEDDSLPRT